MKESLIEQLGEIGLIERIVKRFHVNKQIVTVGAGEDDCAVIDIDKAKGGHKYLVVTTDTVQESTHFPAGISPFKWVGLQSNKGKRGVGRGVKRLFESFHRSCWRNICRQPG